MKGIQFTKNFNSKEFDSPDLPNSGINMNREFVKKLQRIRTLIGEPLHINSGYRTKMHNAKIGGIYNSEHLNGKAADIFTRNSQIRFLIIKLALEIGFTRIGIGTNFIHLDISSDKPDDVIWLY